MCSWSMMNLQDASSTSMEQIIFFNDYSLMIIFLITLMILINIISLLNNKLSNKFILQNQNIEIIWTILPMFMLIFMAIPSLKLLYLNDEINSPSMTIKTIGHQWYWSYEYSDFNNIDFDSFMLNLSLNNKNSIFRLLDVDNRLIMPFNNNIRLLISSTDVIHSWTVPSLGIKVDSIPGRINQTMMNINRPGIYFGQCSEICGMNHSFMPIVIESTSKIKFINWIKNLL